jgi:hypothetical protein
MVSPTAAIVIDRRGDGDELGEKPGVGDDGGGGVLARLPAP